MSVLSSLAKYLGLASKAVQEAETSQLAGATKKQIAIGLVLSAAHAGETVENATVQKIVGIVELAVQIANATGLFGAAKTTPVAVPSAE